jgi:bifunctional non-homologous end joining protein LigD
MAECRSAASRGSLTKYKHKRHFDQTPEPAGRVGHAKGNSYLIQKHEARRLHYDFRLELNGVLKSWAVTKGPSLDPADRRLAVHVEDHPIEYGSFEGSIPKGQYGGGTVMLWDRGTWDPVGDASKDYQAGKLKFALHGDRLQGGWMLVRMGGRFQEGNHDNWLLIKERDAFARPGEGDAILKSASKSVATGKTMAQLGDTTQSRVWQSNRPVPESKIAKIRARGSRAIAVGRPALPAGAKRAPLPEFIAPELATLADKPPEGDQWLHEIKIDGYRAFCRRENGSARFLTRTGLDWTDRFGEDLVKAVTALPARSLALDGEIAVLKDDVSNFAALQEALSSGHKDQLSYIVFDLLYLNGNDLRNVPLIDRKRMLQALLASAPESPKLVFSGHIEASGATVYQRACTMKLEGIVSKRLDLPYRSGRGGDWVKLKCATRQEFVIGGYTHSKAEGRDAIGALLLGYYEEEKLRYAGRVGTGFSHQLARDLLKKLKSQKIDRTPFASVTSEERRGAQWVRPELVCEVEFGSWTGDKIVRHTSFQGLREDKPAKSVTLEQAKAPPAPTEKPTESRKKKSPAAVKSLPADHAIAGVTITHPDRIVFPESGITKEQLARYYNAVATWMLPELLDRPLSLLRCPSGIGEQCFFQKHFATGAKSLRRVMIEEKHGSAEYLVVSDSADWIALVQEGVIEVHPWGALADNPDKPDRLIFDFDPAPDVTFAKVVEAAHLMKGLLEQLDLVSFAKTTGGKGLHVVVPLRRGILWKPLKAFSKALATTLAQARPRDFTVSPMKRDRTGKIFIDYLRNDRGSTAVAAYTVRGRSHAPVAMPLSWDEIKPGLRPDRFTLETVPALIKSRKSDPWKALYTVKQSIPAAALKAAG